MARTIAEHAFTATAGAVVVLDVHTGRVLAGRRYRALPAF